MVIVFVVFVLVDPFPSVVVIVIVGLDSTFGAPEECDSDGVAGSSLEVMK